MSFVGFSASERYIAGDSRANEHAALTATHILMIREHNRIADLLQTQHPDWTDEDIYQAARKYVTALIQKVTYDEYLPSMGVYYLNIKDLTQLSTQNTNGYDPLRNGSFPSG